MTEPTNREPIPFRAGSIIDHRVAYKLTGDAKGRKLHGIVDPSQRLYQTGGELRNFLFRKRSLISLDLEIWNTIRTEVDRLEFIDHDTNVCYCTNIDLAEQHGVIYDAGIGQRWGIPFEYFEVIKCRP